MQSALAPPEVEFNFQSADTNPNPDVLADFRKTMTNNVGVVRSASGLKQALRDIAKQATPRHTAVA